MTTANYIVYVKMDIAPIRQIFETVKEQVAKIPIEFVTDKTSKSDKMSKSDMQRREDDTDNQGGIKIYTVSNTKSVIITCKLFSKYMDIFILADDHKVMFDILSVYKFIKSLDKSIKSIKIYIAKNAPDKIIFDVDHTKHSQQLIKIIPEYKIPKVMNWDAKVIIKAKQLKTTCQRMLNYGDVISVICTQTDLTFKYNNGDDSSGMDIYSTKSDNIDSIANITICVENPENYIYKGIFNIKSLSIFSKSASLSEDIILVFKTDFVMFVTYTIGNYGVMICGIPPTKTENRVASDPKKMIEMKNRN
jgi:hypothetical protein